MKLFKNVTNYELFQAMIKIRKLLRSKKQGFYQRSKHLGWPLCKVLVTIFIMENRETRTNGLGN